MTDDYYETTTFARYALIKDVVVRLDEIQTVTPLHSDQELERCTVYYRNGHTVNVEATPQEIFELLGRGAK
jgi:hypothetical protein